MDDEKEINDDIKIDESLESLREVRQEMWDRYPNLVRYSIIILLIILIGLVCYASFIYGSARVCDDLDGVLDADLVCHLGYTIECKINNPNSIVPDLNFSLGAIE